MDKITSHRRIQHVNAIHDDLRITSGVHLPHEMLHVRAPCTGLAHTAEQDETQNKDGDLHEGEPPTLFVRHRPQGSEVLLLAPLIRLCHGLSHGHREASRVDICANHMVKVTFRLPGA